MPERADGYTDDTMELVQCAQINFDNVGRMMPGLKSHPLWIMARCQFNAVAKRLQAYDKTDQV